MAKRRAIERSQHTPPSEQADRQPELRVTPGTRMATGIATASLLVSVASLGLAWKAGSDANRFAERELAVGTEAQKRERRAYLSLEKANWNIPRRMPSTGDATIRVDFVIENMGATPATVYEYSADSALGVNLNEAAALELERGLRVHSGGSTIFKTGTSFVGGRINAAEHAAFFRGELEWMVMLRVKYADIFGDPHVTTQCIIAVQHGDDMDWSPCRGKFLTN